MSLFDRGRDETRADQGARAGSGPLNLGGSECNGYEENDRTAVCVQDLQRGDGRGWATCGLGERSP